MHTLRMLVVDDEMGMRKGIERVLRDWRIRVADFDDEVSFETKLAATGAEAMALIDSEEFDIAILDYKLPDMKGLDIMQRLSEQEPKKTLAIMVTAYASLDVAISATRIGAFDFLTKPFTPEEIRHTIEKAAQHVFLRRKARELEAEKRKVRFQFISVLAHELKSPIAAVEGYLRIIESRVSGENLSDYDRIIKRSMERLEGMNKMILDLLDLTRIESGTKQRTIADLDLVASAREALEDLGERAKARGISLEFAAPDALPVRGDADELRIIWNNVLSNAVKYNRENGSVKLTIVDDGERARIECRDTGIGMTPEEKERLFGEFVRIKNSATKNISGSGLGLSILKRLVSLYGGAIEVESEYGVGTTFRFTILKASPAS